MPEIVVVTGAAGFVGSHCVKLLLERGTYKPEAPRLFSFFIILNSKLIDVGLLVPVPTLGLAFKLVQMLVLEVARLWVLGRVYTLALLNIIFSTNLFTTTLCSA